MSRLVAFFDPSLAARGEFLTQAPNRCSWLYVMNESSTFLQLDLGSNGQPLVQPWRNRLFSLPDPIQTVAWSVVATLQSGSAPASMVYVEKFDPKETPSASLDSAVFRQSNLGNAATVSGATTSVQNDGGAAGITVVEATPTGASSSQLLLKNDGSGTLGGGHLLISSAGLLTLPAGAVPVASITAGALPSGVTLPAGQVSAGALPSGVTLPAGQVTSLFRSAGGGAAGVAIWEGTTDPGASATEGDIWIDG